MSSDVTQIPGVGPVSADRLKRLGVATIDDLLYLLPVRYLDRSLSDSRSLVPTTQWACLRGTIRSTETKTAGGLAIVKATLADRTGETPLVWFFRGRGRFLAPVRQGDAVWAWGKIKWTSRGPEMQSPECCPSAGKSTLPPLPIYPLTKGITQKKLRQWISWALTRRQVEESLSEELLARRGLLPLPQALQALHRPKTMADPEAGRRRLAFGEFYRFQVNHRRRRSLEANDAFACAENALQPSQFFARLPFAPTPSQIEAIRRCSRAMASPRPMKALLQGDVGSGKTVVAAFVAARAACSGYQAALLAPTKLLVDQHVATLRSLLAPWEIDVAAIDGDQRGGSSEELLDRLERGDPIVAVGTHALLEPRVRFARLAAAIIDEQHRFGVVQRRLFEEKGRAHALALSATPIPRTLALALYADLDVIELKEKPKGRRPVDTRWIHPRDRKQAYGFVRREVERGRQAYAIFPSVWDDDEEKGAVSQAAWLASTWLKGVNVAVVHGQMPARDQEDVMRRFLAGDVQVLVATTVVEVGVDAPKASAIVIEKADRYGLAQLHQLRGRVGRGAAQGYALLISDGKGEHARRRLEALRSTDDGFALAELDLTLRGPGELLGLRQAGPVDFSAADLFGDRDLLLAAKEEAERELRASEEG